MYPVTIQLDNGEVFSCVESAYMAHKPIKLDLRFTKLNGFEAKKLGKTLVLHPDWNNVKIDIMRSLLKIKFSNNGLAEQLKSIQGEIVEDNYWHDYFWGRCNGIGENHLGQLLMEIRDTL
jgi:predicted NAD-dependent protein-ADP-ribosyltransferase YbiA (DUF1768 family)